MKLKIILNYTFFIVLIGVLGFLYSFSSDRNSAKKTQTPEVEFQAGDNHFLTHSMVDKLLIQNKEPVKNLPKSMLDLQGLEQNVLSNPYVEKATVFSTINGELKTIIKQREPVARIVDKTSSYYVDNVGVKIPLSKNFSARVPLVSGLKKEEELEEITKLINEISYDNFLKKEIIGIQKNAKQEYVFDVRSGNYKIEFGKYSNSEIKFKKLKAFYNKAYKDETIHNYKNINVKYHNQVVCTK